MSELKIVENFQFLIQFIVPGIVAVYFRSLLTNGRLINQKDQIVSLLTISLIWNIIWNSFNSYFFTKIMSFELSEINIFSLFIGPSIFGIFLGLNDRRQWLRRFLSKCRLHTVDPIPSAWDRLFNAKEPCWMIITLKDGSKIGGFWGNDSIASFDPTERDIFISQKCGLDHNNVLTGDFEGGGIYVSHGEIRTIEFWPDNESRD